MSLPSIRHQGLPPYHSGLPGHWGLSTHISSHTAPGHPSLPLHEAASSRPPQRPAGSSPGTPSLPESHAAPGHSLQDTSWPDLADARKVPVPAPSNPLMNPPLEDYPVLDWLLSSRLLEYLFFTTESSGPVRLPPSHW